MTAPLELQRHVALRIAEREGRGRGLIAVSAIPAGALLDVAPVIPMTAADAAAPGTVLYDYPFRWDDPPHVEAIALGAISMANHATDANARFETDIPAKVVRLYALRDISAGEEVTIDYAIPLWFEEHA